MTARRVLIAVCSILFALTGCEAPPTPLPAALVPTPTAALQSADAGLGARFRVGLSPEARAFFGDALSPERVEIGVDGAEFPTLERYDLIVAFGRADGWQRAPDSITLSLSLQVDQPPLDDPVIREAVSRLFEPDGIAVVLSHLDATAIDSDNPALIEQPQAMRALLANAGYPDGVALTVGGSAPGLDSVIAWARAYGLDLRRTFLNNEPSHLQWIGQRTGSDSTAAQTEIALVTVPIRYQVREGLTVTFADNGLPLPAAIP
ncbi:MAG: hypothetical protein SGJ24_05905 [Chloroflexota bacterium]|nr:hypothetical protein [Chloroflexota bacterium]